ncbi:beta-ketoacyl synthase N-terminal-like domain-containing protein [Zunongwangia sp. HGR-M22]|uniref:beta-ketoacyl synthase N-terminal-like domain-containing protein n=1 Tax=Zunongwangia sp. HGR-M22 TaxID=3015168 RepID=UPI0022DDE8BD|nr:beta-ketoacyl synthase N-terminal-like domain-containing protein [Zunongwangia sp. HGR-M22]WBL27275.1 beta-ketoacyl synthase chain length factor [Zunongwangia sp. HGR-M22]
MDRKIYINGAASISAQTEEEIFLENAKVFQENIFPAREVNYKEHIKPMMLRRMSKAIKMGLLTAKQALTEAGIDIPDSIIVGTGEGCKQDTEKFLENILNENEQFLTPTAFIQSTHNTVGGQIALDLKCSGYNMTYTQNSASFESALIDAKLQFTEDMETRCVLVGGVDELAKTSTPFYNLDGQLKGGKINSSEVLESQSGGTITSEGAAFFLLSEIRTQNSYAEIVDCAIYRIISEDKLTEEISWFLKKNDLDIEDLDVVILGNNGDSRYDHYYDQLQGGIFKNTLQLGYKHLVGDYNTVTAYACWLGAEILKRNIIPQQLKLNAISVKKPKSILIYNQYLGKNHSLTLLRSL